MTGDAQQFKAEEHEGREPVVRLLWMTSDPLGALAAMSSMYSGRVIRSLSDLTHEDRMQALKDTSATHLRAPFEAIKLHFLLENVDRALTHQLVRQRTAAYSQESLRFAVKGNLLKNTSLPPSLEETESLPVDLMRFDLSRDSNAQQLRNIWDDALRYLGRAYHTLIAEGMPAEEARGILPHATLTRVHYVTDLRNLLEHAGNRLCTQAQFHWRTVFQQIAQEIRDFWRRPGHPGLHEGPDFFAHSEEVSQEFSAIADLFKPICYQLGRCPFQASFDRECTIRERVEMNHDRGIPSNEWHVGHAAEDAYEYIPPIRDEEWSADPSAARK